jgi:uncharacterized LabA/DUF88 family protein
MAYLFVDGAYLTRVLQEWGVAWVDRPQEFAPSAVQNSLVVRYEKVFYYDSLAPLAPNESQQDFEKRRAKAEERFNYLRTFPGWHVLNGDAKHRGKGLGRSQVEQKEVDVMIAVDMLTHTYRKNTDQMGFIAGDLDFRPLLEALVREGMYVDLICEPRSASGELKHAADRWHDLDFWQMLNIVDPKVREQLGSPSFSTTSQHDPPPENSVAARGLLPNNHVAAVLYRPLGPSGRSAVSATVASPGSHFPKVESNHADMAQRIYDTVVHPGEPLRWVAAP